MNPLSVFLNNHLIGHLFYEHGKLSFQYVNRAKIPLSKQFPIQAERFPHAITESFFSGLLPDEPVRTHIARILKISPHNTYGLLEQLGGDCAGAIRIVPNENEDTRTHTTKVLTDAELFSILQNLPQRPLGIGISGVRISGAGAQDKLMVCKLHNQWSLPLEGTPSTHIIKPNITGFPHSVLNEYFCMTLAQQIGLETPNVDILTLKNHDFYVIERYDRIIENGVYTRLHQEDFCQILGVHPNHKYQNEGGPSITHLFGALRTFQQQGVMKGTDTFRLMRLILFNFLIGNGDAHGKNFSIVYRNNRVELAPCYDLLSTLVYGNWHKESMAMKIASKYKFKAIALHHFERMAEDIGISPKFVRKEGRKITQSMNKQSKALLLSLENSGYDVSLLKEIVAIIEKQSRLFL